MRAPGGRAKSDAACWGAGYVLFRWRKQGKTTTAQFDPLQRRVKRLLEQGRTQT